MIKAIFVPIGLVCAVSAADAEALYKLSLNLVHTFPNPVVLGVNRHGASVGYADFLLVPGTTIALAWPSPTIDGNVFLHAPPNFPNGFANAINNRNVVVGGAWNADYSVSVPCVWMSSYTCRRIQALPGATASSILAINTLNQMAGVSANHATAWSATGVPTDLGVQPGDVESTGNGIGSTGTVVGSSTSAIGESHAVLWHGTTQALLPAMAGATRSEAYGVNGADIAVGYNVTASGSYPIVWNAGTMTVLPGTGDFGIARAVNDQSVVVGQSNGVAVRWTGPAFEQMQDLNDLHDDVYPGAVLLDAAAISSNGIIVGRAIYNGVPTKYTLIPR